MGAIIALIVVKIQLNSQRKRDKEKDDALFSDQRHFIFNAINSLEKGIKLYENDLNTFIENFPEKEDRLLTDPTFFTTKIDRISKFSEQDILKSFINNEKDITLRNIISDKVFELFETLDYLKNIEVNYNKTFDQFYEQFNSSFSLLNEKSSDFQYHIRNLLHSELVDERIFQLQENQEPARIASIINPLIKILDRYNSDNRIFLKKVYPILIEETNNHLAFLNIQTEPEIDKMYDTLGVLAGSYNNCMRLQGLFKENAYTLPLQKITERKEKIKGIIHYLKSLNNE